MRNNIYLWSMVCLLYILNMPSCVVELVIKAVPGQNVSLPCRVDQVNQQTVMWWGHTRYISSGKEMLESFGVTRNFFSIPGEGADYSLFIMIPDDISVWPSLAETYKCRLVSKSDNTDFQELEIHELQIYQPNCTIILINGSKSVASCSYQNIPGFQAAWLVGGSSVYRMRDGCTSDVCTLNYTYNQSAVNPQDLMCRITITGIASVRTLTCSINQTHITTSPQGMEVSSPSTYSTKYITDVENSHSTVVQASLEGTEISILTTDAATEDNATRLIVIISLVALISLFLTITILYFVRRSFKNKNSVKKSSTDESVYSEIDQQEHTNKISMMEGPSQSDNINFKQSAEDSVMKENDIYQSADTNAYELSLTVNKVSVAKPDEVDYLDQTHKTDEEIDHFTDGINMNEKKDEPTTSQTGSRVETSDDLGYIENENEAYQSLDRTGI